MRKSITSIPFDNLKSERDQIIGLIHYDIKNIVVNKLLDKYKEDFMRGRDTCQFRASDIGDLIGYRSRSELRMFYSREEIDSGICDLEMSKYDLVGSIDERQLRDLINPILKGFDLIAVRESDYYIRITPRTKSSIRKSRFDNFISDYFTETVQKVLVGILVAICITLLFVAIASAPHNVIHK